MNLSTTFHDQIRAVAETRPPTVWVARRLLAHVRDRLVTLRIDDGQFADATLYGYYVDVVHSPEVGFSLLVRGLMPYAERSARRRGEWRKITRVPLRIVRQLPSDFHFLTRPRAEWPVGALEVACPHCGQERNWGRFCTGCGRLVRRGGGRVPGPAYPVQQAALRKIGESQPSDVAVCGCGGLVHRSERFCAKCGGPAPVAYGGVAATHEDAG